ncbi:MAG: Lrp/AsnC family transcriptional regulator [Methylocystaceae bacterium]|nr:Lrp/AsnC family transcriptional regulator [Methylocystaceae bacterium]
MTKMDKDLELISLLKADGRISVSDIARHLNVSRTAAQFRLKKLEKSGVIEGYTVRLSRKFEHKGIEANVMIKSPPSQRRHVEEQLILIPHIVSLYSIAGTYDLSARVRAENVAELDVILDRIGAIKGIGETMSSIILATKLSR